MTTQPAQDFSSVHIEQLLAQEEIADLLRTSYIAGTFGDSAEDFYGLPVIPTPARERGRAGRFQEESEDETTVCEACGQSFPDEVAWQDHYEDVHGHEEDA